MYSSINELIIIFPLLPNELISHIFYLSLNTIKPSLKSELESNCQSNFQKCINLQILNHKNTNYNLEITNETLTRFRIVASLFSC